MIVLIYFLVTFIWSTTWIAVHFQLGTVPMIWSVSYRFALAGFVALLVCFILRKPIRLNLKQHYYCFLLGLLLFSVSYILNYLAVEDLISALVALLNATMIIFNVINARIFFKHPLRMPVILGSMLGILGLFTIFSSEIDSTTFNNWSATLEGIVFAVVATLIASFGAMVSLKVQKNDLPLIQSNAYAMLYGAALTAIIAVAIGAQPSFDYSFTYLFNLGYLAIFGSIVAFGGYLWLLQQIGPAKIAYITVITPVVSMIISTFVEDLSWQPSTFLGLILVILGSILVLRFRETTAHIK